MPTYQVVLSHYPGYEPYDKESGQLAAYDAGLTVLTEQPEAAADELLQQADALLNINWRVGAELMDRMPRCRLVVVYGIGTDAVDLAAATERGIVVSNIPLATVDDVANHAVALLLACLRRLLPLDAAVRRGEYDWEAMRPSHNPRDKLLGLVAYGNIARAVGAKMAAAFGTRVVAYDPYVASELAARHGVRLVSLKDLLREADLISVHAPLTAESRGLLGEAELGLMKPTACLVLTSRGGVVDEAALVRALQQNRLAGAGLDVQVREPLPPDDPLLGAPNLILTPHCAGYSEESLAEVKQLACEAACRILSGRWPRWVVNPKVKPKFELVDEGQV